MSIRHFCVFRSRTRSCRRWEPVRNRGLGARFRRVCSAVLLFALVGLVLAANSRAEDFAGVTYAVLDPDTNEVIGSANYAIQRANGKAVLVGRGYFRNGESDLEHDELEPAGNGSLPALVRFEHSFFNPDGTVKIAGYADARTGKASCSSYENGQPIRRESQLAFPADTYAGASIVVALQHALKNGIGDLSFHVFDCAPGPTIAPVELTSVEQHESWNRHPGDLAKADLTADLGTFGNLINGILPHRSAWFDPAGGWEYVGGRIQRYFADGPQIVLVRRESREQASRR